LSARVVTVTGADHVTAAAVIDAAGLSGQPPLVSVDPAATAAKIERLPWVLRASVSRHWPDGVRITVVERTPVAVVAAGASGWALVDRTGRVLADVSTPPAGMPRLDVTAVPHAPGSWLRSSADPGLAVAATLPPAFVAQVTTVEATASGTLRLQLTTPISVLLGNDAQLRQKYLDVASILAHAFLHPNDVIDVTVPSSPVVAGP
jgi:cell division protein FtsQ